MTPLEAFLTGPGPDILLGLAIALAILSVVFTDHGPPSDTKKPGA